MPPPSAGPAGLAEAPGYGSTLQRDRAGGPAGGYRPQDRRPGRDSRGRASDGGYGGGGYGGGNGHGGGPGGPGSRGRGFKAWLLHGSWWRHWSWRKVLALFAGAIATLMLAVVIVVIYAYSKTVVPTAATEAALQQSSQVYFSDGTTRIGTISANSINRYMLTEQQIPQVIKNAVIAAEDRHFYTEGGISITGTLRAAYQDLFGSGAIQGGSSITEQFVKNYYEPPNAARTLKTKIKEALVSIKIAHMHSKGWILTQYLNTVSFGASAYGVGAAAQTYFNESAQSLTVAQAAMLAAMINNPYGFNPSPDGGAAYTALVARWHYVLDNMVRDGALTQQAANAQQFPKIVPGQLSDGATGWRGYIMDAVKSELSSRYGYHLQQIGMSGLKIVTTFNESMMKTLYRSVNEAKRQMAQGGQALPWWAHVGVVLEKPGSGAILAMYGGPGTSVPHCLRLICQLNMAMDSRNQVGSSFKPYVLATAVHMNMNAKTSVLNGYSSICSPSDAYPEMFSVTVSGTACPTTPFGWFNFQSIGESNGPVSVATASAKSLNTAYGDLIHRVGTQNVINMAQQFGVNVGAYPNGSSLQAMKGQSGIALGTASLTVEEQATFFATLADGGVYYTPHVIAKITLSSGGTVPLRVRHHRVLTPAQAADVDWALSFDTINGTGVPNGQLNPYRPTLAKTGTTNVSQDAFFIGAIPQYSLAVGMFTNSQNQAPNATQTLNVLPTINGQLGGFGGAWPAWIWHLFMTNQFSHLPVLQLPTPDFTGFDKWVQVIPPKRQHKNPGPSCGPQHGRAFVSPCPTPTPKPSCGPSAQQPCPTPTRTCTPAAGVLCPPPTPSPPGGHGNQQGLIALAALAAQPADEPDRISVRLPGG